jgi:hypothetical protein
MLQELSLIGTINTAEVEIGLHVMVRFVLKVQDRALRFHNSHISSRS